MRATLGYSMILLASGWLGGCADAGGSGAVDADAVPRLVAREELRIGSVDDPDAGFSAVSMVDVDADGQIYAFEAQEVEIRVFSPDGGLVRRIGRKGEGPGEFERIQSFGVARDTIWTADAGLRRLTLFSRDGVVLSTGPLPEVRIPLHGNQTGHVRPVLLRADGLLASDMTTFSGARGVTTDVGATDTVQVPRVLFNVSGQVVDTVGFELRAPPEPGSIDWVEFGGARFRKPTPPSGRPLSVTTADGRIWVDRAPPTAGSAAVFTMTRLDYARDTVYRREFTYRPARYSDAYLDTIAWRSARIPGGGYAIVGGLPQIPPMGSDSIERFRAVRASMSFPEFQPPIQGHYLANDGALWLRREDDGGPVYRWLVLDDEGRARGQVELPRRARPGWSRGDLLVTIEQDAFDVPWLVRYRIQRPRA